MEVVNRFKEKEDGLTMENAQGEASSGKSSPVALCTKGIINARARLIRQNTEQFINAIFWHSIAMTMTTPLARLTRGR